MQLNKELELKRMKEIYRDIHEDLGGFEGKDTIHFILTREIVRLNKELGNPAIDTFIGCRNCSGLLKYHNR